MRKFVIAVFLILFASKLGRGQGSGYVQVTGSKTCYANGSVTAAFVNQNTSPQLPLLNGSVFPTTNVTNFDSNGNFSFFLADNNIISPTPSQWKITACQKSGGQPNCGSTTITITQPLGGGPQDISGSMVNFSCGGSSGGPGGQFLQYQYNDGGALGGAQAVTDSATRSQIHTPTIFTSGIQPKVNIANPVYGAVGDDSTDDTADIQSAIGVAQPLAAAVQIPQGIYKVSGSGLLMSSAAIAGNQGASIEGTGSNESQGMDCTNVNGAPCLTIQGSGSEGGNPYTRFQLNHLYLNGNNSTTPTHGLFMDRFYIAKINDSTVSSFANTSAAAVHATNFFNVEWNGGNYSGGFPNAAGGNGFELGSATPNCFNTSNAIINNTLIQRFTKWGVFVQQPTCNLFDNLDIHDTSIGDNGLGSIHVDGTAGAQAFHEFSLVHSHLEGGGDINGNTIQGYATHVDLHNLLGARIVANDIKDSTVGIAFDNVQAAYIMGNTLFGSLFFTRPACPLTGISETGTTVTATLACTTGNTIQNQSYIIVSATSQYNGNFGPATVSGTTITWTVGSSGLTPEATGFVTLNPVAMTFKNNSSAFIAQNSIFSNWYGIPIVADDSSALNLQYPAMTATTEGGWNGVYAPRPKVYRNTFFNRYQIETFGGVQNPLWYYDSLWWLNPDGPNAFHIPITNRGYTEGSGPLTSGCYTAGHFHRNIVPAAPTTGIFLYGWIRLTTQTTSCTNTVPTDWLPLYTINSQQIGPNLVLGNNSNTINQNIDFVQLSSANLSDGPFTNTTGGQTITNPNTVAGLDSGCVQTPCNIAVIRLTNQTASVGSTTLYAPSVDSVGYEIGCILKTTTAGSAGTATCSVTCAGASSTSGSLSLTAANSSQQTATRAEWNTGNAACTYSTTVTGNTGGVFEAYLWATRLTK